MAGKARRRDSRRFAAWAASTISSAKAIVANQLRAYPNERQTELGISDSCWRIAAMKGKGNVDASEDTRSLQRGKSILRKQRAEGTLPAKFADLELRFDSAPRTKGQVK